MIITDRYSPRGNAERLSCYRLISGADSNGGGGGDWWAWGGGGDWNQLRGKPILPFLKVTLFSFLFLLSHSLVVVVFFF